MLTVTVTFDSSETELRLAADFLNVMAERKSTAPTFAKPEQLPLKLPAQPVAVAPPVVTTGYVQVESDTPPTASPVVAAAATPPVLNDLDAAGLPWDERIHSGGRVKNADGKWRTRRGVGDDVIARVEGELRLALASNAMAAPVAVTVVPPPPVVASEPPSAPVPQPTTAFAAALAAQASPPPPPAPVPVVSEGPTDFSQFMQAVVKVLGEKRLSQQDLNLTLATHGVSGLGTLQTASTANPLLIPTIWADLTKKVNGG